MWCRMREQTDETSDVGEERANKSSGKRPGTPGVRSSAADDVPDEWSAMLNGSGRLAIGRQHFGGSIDDFENDTASDHSSEEQTELFNQPVPLFAP